MVRVEEFQVLCAEVHGGNHGSSAESKRVRIHHGRRTSSTTFFRTALEGLAVLVKEHCITNAIQDNSRIARHIEP